MESILGEQPAGTFWNDPVVEDEWKTHDRDEECELSPVLYVIG